MHDLIIFIPLFKQFFLFFYNFNKYSLEYKEYILNLWDVGGQKSIRTYWRNYFEMTDGIIWVVDSVDRCRLEECRKQLRDILSQEKLAGASLLIFANKQDLGNCTSINCSYGYVMYMFAALHST